MARNRVEQANPAWGDKGGGCLKRDWPLLSVILILCLQISPTRSLFLLLSACLSGRESITGLAGD